jgi:hypothetical protein
MSPDTLRLLYWSGSLGVHDAQTASQDLVGWRCRIIMPALGDTEEEACRQGP